MDPLSPSTGLKRAGLEKFYTKAEVAEQCIHRFMEIVQPEVDDLILEPSAGDGSFSRKLPPGYSVEALDISPEHRSIRKLDFLKDYRPPRDRTIHVLGNPPFGRQSSLARQFIKKCGQFAASISFILPRSFRKDSFQQAFPPLFHCVYEVDLEDDAFACEGRTVSVPCVFQIWLKKDTPRPTCPVQTPTYFTFVKKHEAPDFSIRRVGSNAGQIYTDTEHKSTSTHFFIKLDRRIPTFLRDFQRHVKFATNNTVAPRSVSKPELIGQMNSLYANSHRPKK